MDPHLYECSLDNRSPTVHMHGVSLSDDFISPSTLYMGEMLYTPLSDPNMYTSGACNISQPLSHNTARQVCAPNMGLSSQLQTYPTESHTEPDVGLSQNEDDSQLVNDIMSAFGSGPIMQNNVYPPIFHQPDPSLFTSSVPAASITSHPSNIQITSQSSMQSVSMMHSQQMVVPQSTMPSSRSSPDPFLNMANVTTSTSAASHPYTDPIQHNPISSTISSNNNPSYADISTNPCSPIRPLLSNRNLRSSDIRNSTSIKRKFCSSNSTPASTDPLISLSRASFSSSTNAPSNSEDDFLEEISDLQKKKERRRQQVRFASRRRRKKQKDEESSLRDRIEELKEQIRIIGGDLSEQCSQMASLNEQALKDAYEKQLITVQNLRKNNEKLKEQLCQHENFAKMIQHGLNALPNDTKHQQSALESFSGRSLSSPILSIDRDKCHEAVREAYDEMKGFGPSVDVKTNICYAMGWKTELWASGTSLNVHAIRTVSDKDISQVADISWDIMTSAEKSKRIYPDVKHFRIVQTVSDDIVVIHRIASVGSESMDREFISVAFQCRDGEDYYLGMKSIDVASAYSENCVRGEECQGWKFTGKTEQSKKWKAHYVGYYDVKGNNDDTMMNQLANEAMFGMLRWESETMHPLSV